MLYDIQYSAKEINGEARITNKVLRVAAFSTDEAVAKLSADLRQKGYLLTEGKFL
jgi:hypothetical protein